MSQITLDSIANLVRNTVKEEVTEIKEKIKFLPTKDEFYAKMDELMGEIKSMREEVAVVTGYKDQEDYLTVTFLPTSVAFALK